MRLSESCKDCFVLDWKLLHFHINSETKSKSLVLYLSPWTSFLGKNYLFHCYTTPKPTWKHKLKAWKSFYYCRIHIWNVFKIFMWLKLQAKKECLFIHKKLRWIIKNFHLKPQIYKNKIFWTNQIMLWIYHIPIVFQKLCQMKGIAIPFVIFRSRAQNKLLRWKINIPLKKLSNPWFLEV